MMAIPGLAITGWSEDSKRVLRPIFLQSARRRADAGSGTKRSVLLAAKVIPGTDCGRGKLHMPCLDTGGVLDNVLLTLPETSPPP